MSIEIERKFLVIGDAWKSGRKVHLYQAYLSENRHCTVRIRIAEDKAFLTIKGLTVGITREEFEYEIPLVDAKVMVEEFSENLVVEKYRYYVDYDGFTWEVDQFLGVNKGLVVAEVELPSINAKPKYPAWVGKEVSNDPRYFNSYLAKYPYQTWS